MTAPTLDALLAAAARFVHGDPAEPRVRERSARAVWSTLAEPGDGVAGALVGALGAEEAYTRAFVSAKAPPLAQEVGRGAELAAGIARWRPRLSPTLLAGALAGAARCDARLLIPGDAGWPEPVGDLGDHAPLCLWVRSGAPLLNRPAVAVVGARAASAYGEHVAAELAAGISSAGVSVVSGGAYGIDGAAHRGALGAGGATIAVLAGGCDIPYPRGHTELFERILRAGGALVSEVPCNTTPTKWRFLARNRVIAAMTGATVVVEAGARSGSLNTAGHAAALGRALGAVPGPVTSATSIGCHRLLRDYDARCVTDTAEVLELIGGGTPEPLDLGPRTDERTRLRDAMSSRSPREPQALAARSGLSIAQTESMLGTMMLEGSAVPVEGGWRLCRP